MASELTLNRDSFYNLFEKSIEKKISICKELEIKGGRFHSLVFLQGDTRHILRQYTSFLKRYEKDIKVFKEFRDLINVYYSLKHKVADIDSVTISLEAYLFSFNKYLIPNEITEDHIFKLYLINR